ncbi:YwgA family protein [Bacillus alkalicellulosilyticus]|uniref:YwgA family protein n=1 Tax=Alkalihalobacterium alkalicellulosilyticum TaxID=1912214 RepID=UPI0009978156|nr:hypothetical protein [Bacillus alkalicellulosilyticus]
MLNEHVKLLTVIERAGEIIGRKKLQKIVYISKKLKFPFTEKFKFHMFGPYSEELTLRIEELCNLGFLEEIKENKGGYSQYRYTITEEGLKFIQMYQIDLPEINRIVTNMNEQSSRFLELVSTILYFDDLSEAEVKDKVFTIKKKQNYSEEDLIQAFEYIAALRSTEH